jgi:hypothetical protein
MRDAEDDEDDARTVMRDLAPMAPRLAPRAAGTVAMPAVGMGGIPGPQPFARPLPAAGAAARVPQNPPVAMGAPAPPPPSVDDEDSNDEAATMMRSPEAMADALAAHAQRLAAANGPNSTIALPSAYSPAGRDLGPPSPAGLHGAMPRMSGQAALAPPGTAPGAFTPALHTAPMQTLALVDGQGPLGSPGQGPDSRVSMSERQRVPLGASGSIAGAGVGIPPSQLAPMPPDALVAPPPQVLGGLDPAPPGGLAPAPVDEGWSLAKLAVAAVIALVVTAGITFAFLRLRGM